MKKIYTKLIFGKYVILNCSNYGKFAAVYIAKYKNHMIVAKKKNLKSKNKKFKNKIERIKRNI